MSTITEILPVTSEPTYVPDYRLTRRGRVAVLLLGLTVLLAIGVVFAGGSLASEEPAPTETIVVAPGDTLWEIASDLSEDGDVRDMMRTIEQLNSLDTVALAVGQRLQVPLEAE
ncbi:MAG: LysM peptidoglycan-binding domain-containing protein [Nocardioides sp.]|uniref:LysM peptidoglycan-binding domain-containing protein n=1 Tax=Nocardioides sp. TaxID=35761 RepID=UPI0023A774E9|nr:LysM peptidoglycan-binding domain-containing protein [Nocardioides sp.]MDE0776299.1 LysM peptidoglycan-binding domain-containing protein [Nocardioides sp.]